MPTSLRTHRPLELLLVEDNPADARLTREALRHGEVDHRLHVVRDGVEALAYLRGEGSFAGEPRPDLVLLDLNMPRKDGRAVLAEMKADPALKSIPVIVLTTSTAQRDVLDCYRLQAACYIAKPVQFDDFISVVEAIESFWFRVVTFPTA